MPIMGRKTVPEEEEEEPAAKSGSSNGRFTLTWIKDLTQKSFGLSIKDAGVRMNTKTEGKKIKAQAKIPKGNFSYKQLAAATNNFSPANRIGVGGFGSVYKGVLRDGRSIAVKVLSSESMQGEKEFLCEINAFSTMRHPNIVTLFGHCVAGRKKILLVYEYQANGSLHSALFCLKERLNWETRVKICIGIARGLLYLHEGAEFKIIHRDIKLSNVLLDQNLHPKISDFGCAKLLKDGEDTHTLVIAGTLGYVAPEYITHGYLTEKADVYSFGVLVLELVSGRRCLDFSRDPQSLLEFAEVLKKKRNLISLLDQDLTDVSENEATMVLELAMLCTSYSPEGRPNMSDVVKILHGKNVLNTPSVGSDDFARVASDEINLSDLSDNYLDSTIKETVKASTGEGADYSNSSLICTNSPTSETRIITAKTSSTSSTFEDITYMGDEAKLEYIEPHLEEGTYHIECSNEEFEVGCNKWKNSLVGYFFSENGTFDVDKDVVKEVVTQQATGNVSVFSMGNGHLLFQFSCAEDKIRVLESSGLLHVEGKPLVLMTWDWKLKFDKAETMKSIPIWVKIYNLPLFLWDPSCLSKVASALGIPICADQKTMKQQRLDYARVYIQVDASKPLLDTFRITVKGIDYLLSLEYDRKLLRCTGCFTFGHIESKCKLRIKGKQD